MLMECLLVINALHPFVAFSHVTALGGSWDSWSILQMCKLRGKERLSVLSKLSPHVVVQPRIRPGQWGSRAPKLLLLVCQVDACPGRKFLS